MSGSLAGKVIVVTGASKGMGRAFAEMLVDEGARVVLLARSSAALDEVAAKLGAPALAIPCDVSDADTVRAALDDAAAHFGRIDVLVNNAAITSLLKVETATVAEIEREFAVNLLGPIFATSAAIPHLRAAGGGDIVFVSSESVRMAYPFLTLYASTKGGLESFAAGLRGELREQGTRVTVLRSGAVASGGNLSESWPEDRRDEFLAAAIKFGHAHFTGTPALPGSMAQTLRAILSLPRDVNLDLVEARGRAPMAAG